MQLTVLQSQLLKCQSYRRQNLDLNWNLTSYNIKLRIRIRVHIYSPSVKPSPSKPNQSIECQNTSLFHISASVFFATFVTIYIIFYLCERGLQNRVWHFFYSLGRDRRIELFFKAQFSSCTIWRKGRGLAPFTLGHFRLTSASM